MILSLRDAPLPSVTIPLSAIGRGTTVMFTQSAYPITVMGGKFNTAPARVSAVKSASVDYLTSLEQVRITGKFLTYIGSDPEFRFYFSTVVTQTGSNALASASKTGRVT